MSTFGTLTTSELDLLKKHSVNNHGFDLDVEAKALVEWASIPSSVILRKFFISRGYSHFLAEKDFLDHPNFRAAYEYALGAVGVRREELANDGKLNIAMYNRYANIHDKFLLEHEHSEAIFHAKLKEPVAANQDVTYNVVHKYINEPKDVVKTSE